MRYFLSGGRFTVFLHTFTEKKDTISQWISESDTDTTCMPSGRGCSWYWGASRFPMRKDVSPTRTGDVAIHAVCDALLGAAALGDIGLHFPDTSDDFKGIDSKILLQRVVALLRERGYEVGNIDCTIRMQRPKLRPHIDARRAAMAEAMGVAVDRVSVKATTTERLGFEGREEGCRYRPWR